MTNSWMDRKQRIRDELIAEIERVFDGVSREQGITLYQAEAGGPGSLRAPERPRPSLAGRA